jgi:3-oxoacyl-[acyl-carrier-protein] synthase II
MGAVTPLGANLPQTWEALLAGKSGARYLTEEWAEPLPVRIGAPSVVEPASLLDRVEARKLDRSGQFALAAAREAWSDAGRPGVEPERLGVSVSCSCPTALPVPWPWSSARGPAPTRR